MIRLLRAAGVIARRDYTATVFSRSFLLFLVAPLLPLLFGGLFGKLAAEDGAPGPAARPLAVAMAPAARARLEAARVALDARLGEDWLPPLVPAHPGSAVLGGTLAAPVLSGERAVVVPLAGRVRLLVERAAATATGVAPVPLAVRLAPRGPAPPPDRRPLARGAQFALFVVTIILAGMLISNLVEEKSSKVIEVLAAAVPVDAIFLGKLAGMLAVSLTGIAVWGGVGVLVGRVALPDAGLPAPAIGWPGFIALCVVYWAMLYLLLGALYLGVGGQAGSVREVQTLSLPLTLVQLLFFGLAQAAVADPDRPLALVAAIIPWSSPFAMVARAAERAAWWPHLLALAWQAVALALVVRVAARLFRRTVLKSGPASARKSGRAS